MNGEIDTTGKETEVIKPVINGKSENKEEPVMILPMSRIKKIIKLDPEHISSTESANFVLGLATELFIKQLTIDSSEITKSKGRKKIMYADTQKVVSSADIYSFLRDIVPKRAPIGELMTKGLIKLRPKDQQKMEDSIIRNGYRDLDEEEKDVEEGEGGREGGREGGEEEEEEEYDDGDAEELEEEDRDKEVETETNLVENENENKVGDENVEVEEIEEVVDGKERIKDTSDAEKTNIKDADGDVEMSSNVEITKDEN